MSNRVAVIGIPGKWSTEVLADRLEAATGFRLVVDMAEVVYDGQSQSLWAQGHDLCELDGLVVKKITQDYDRHMWDRIELLRVAEAAGVRVFSPSQAILQLVNRLGCTVTLRNHRIPMPKTRVTEDLDAVQMAVEEWGEVVLKPMFSTKARGMLVLKRGQKNLEKDIRGFQSDNPMMYLQQKVPLDGWDLGMVFVGGEYLCTYARVSQTDTWNTTIHSGGHYQGYEPDKHLIELGHKAQAPFGLDFTTVDIALTPDGPIVFEVSAFGGFKGAQEGAGVDAADAYCQHILNSLDNR